MPDAGTAAGDLGDGTVRLSGSTLVVTAPSDIPARHWDRIGQRLVAFAEARTLADPSTVEVPTSRGHRLARELAEAWPASRWNWIWSHAASRAALVAGDVEGELMVALDAAVDQRDVPEVHRVLGSIGFDRTLLPRQADAVARLLKTGSGANFSVPGSGKTTMTYALFACLRAQGIVDRLLVVAPLSAHESWLEEARDCFTETSRPDVSLRPDSWPRRADVVVQNYERIAAVGAGARARAWMNGRRVMVVFDEAHRAKKGEQGLHGRAARDLAGLATRRIVLTGTPMPNSEDDLTAVLDLAWPGAGERLAVGDLAPRAHATWVRLTKHDLGLTTVKPQVERLELDPAHARVYELVAAQGRALADAGLLEARPDIALRATMRLLAVASNPSLLDGRDGSLEWPLDVQEYLDRPLTSEADLKRLIAQSRPIKLLRAAQLASEHHRRRTKLVVWTNFIGNVSELARLLEPYGCAVVTGETPVDLPSAETDRVRQLARFREDEDCVALIATPQTLGEGISLQKVCQAQVHVDRGFNAGLYLQALDRTHRVGMPPGTRAQATALVSRDTIDEHVEETLRNKVDAMRQLLDDDTLAPLALPDDDDVQVDLGTYLPGLVRHLSG